MTIRFEYKYKGFQGELTVTNPDSIQRLRDHRDTAKLTYIFDELIMMVVKPEEQKLSITHSGCTSKELADMNHLSDVKMFMDSEPYHRII